MNSTICSIGILLGSTAHIQANSFPQYLQALRSICTEHDAFIKRLEHAAMSMLQTTPRHPAGYGSFQIRIDDVYLICTYDEDEILVTYVSLYPPAETDFRQGMKDLEEGGRFSWP